MKIYFGHNLVYITEKSKWLANCPDGFVYHHSGNDKMETLISVLDKSRFLCPVFIVGEKMELVFSTLLKNFVLIEAAGGLVKNSNGEYLVIKRRGKWDLPKGKIESNEQCFDAALRETTEETGLSPLEIVSVLQPTYHVYWQDGDHVLKKTYWYEMNFVGNKKPIPQHNEGITIAKWFSVPEIAEIKMNTYGSVLDVLKEVSLI